MIVLEHSEKGTYALALVRIVLGCMLLWAFADKLLGLGMLTTPEAAIVNGGSPTEYYLSQLVSGPLEGVWNALAGNPVVDALLMFGLLSVGLGLLLGVASKLTTVGMVVMMLLMWSLCIPPEDNPVFSHHIVYLLATIAAFYLGGFSALGLEDRWRELGIVRKVPLLE